MSDITKIKVDGELESTYKLFSKNREFEKRAGGGDASSADVFIIHVTPDETNTNVQFDKTTEQIYEAYQSGKYCLVFFIDRFIPIVSVETNGARTFITCCGFTFDQSGQGRAVAYMFETNDGITWTAHSNSPMLYDVRFHGLKIFGSGGKLYTISVDADGNLTVSDDRTIAAPEVT